MDGSLTTVFLSPQRPWHEYEHNFQIMYKVGMGHKPPIPDRLSPEGKDFLSHCLESEPGTRWTASQLLDHPFVKVRRGLLAESGTRVSSACPRV